MPQSAPQAALDQLWADQGAAAFTETQYVRVFAGTYDENVVPNAGLVTSYGDFALILEGDPADDRDNIVLAPSSGTALDINGPDYVTFRHMKVAPVGVEAYAVLVGGSTQKPTVSDIYVTGAIVNPIYISRVALVEDSVIETSRDLAGVEGIYFANRGTVRNCVITQTSASPYGIGIFNYLHDGRIEGCTITGFSAGGYPLPLRVTT